VREAFALGLGIAVPPLDPAPRPAANSRVPFDSAREDIYDRSSGNVCVRDHIPKPAANPEPE
jgi:hypothetical protein